MAQKSVLLPDPTGRIQREADVAHQDVAENDKTFSRRSLVQALAAGAGAMVAGTGTAAAQPAAPASAAPPSTITTPPRDFSPRGAPTTYFWDPDIIAVDPSFNGLAQPNAAIQRLYTGVLWAEGPAWSAQGRYLVWSDIPNNRQMRWSEDDGRVSVFRTPSNNSNGNTFDFQGRQLSCEHLARRVVRYEHDGSATVIADSFDGKKLNSPNDVVPHPDGSYWFTDPPYGGQLYEGEPDPRILRRPLFRFRVPDTLRVQFSLTVFGLLIDRFLEPLGHVKVRPAPLAPTLMHPALRALDEKG